LLSTVHELEVHGVVEELVGPLPVKVEDDEAIPLHDQHLDGLAEHGPGLAEAEELAALAAGIRLRRACICAAVGLHLAHHDVEAFILAFARRLELA
jgi:hypothetical protein